MRVWKREITFIIMLQNLKVISSTSRCEKKKVTFVIRDQTSSNANTLDFYPFFRGNGI